MLNETKMKWIGLMKSRPDFNHVLICNKHELMPSYLMFSDTPFYCQYCRKILKPEELRWIKFEELRKISDEEYESRTKR